MKIILFANTDWYLYNFRLPLAQTLREQGNEVILLSPAGPYTNRFLALGFHWREFVLERSSTNPLTDGLAVIKLWRVYYHVQPDIAHHFTVKCVLYGTFAARMARVPGIVNSITGLGYVFISNNKLLRTVIGILYRLLLHKTWIIFQNPDDQSAFEKNRLVSSARVKLIRGSGVDTRVFQPTPEPKGIPIIILPARLLWDKGIGEFVEAARIIREHSIMARFALVGDTDTGNPSAITLETLLKWQGQSLIEWWGWQENMASIYAQANIVCLPSYREGLPKTLIEAAACARAIVATDVPGCREIVHHEENGLLVPVKNPIALADALQTLITDPDLRKRMGHKGRQIVVTEFDVRKVIQSTLEFYEHINSVGVQNDV